MRSIAQLNGDEFFDFIFALSPILPVIGQLDIVKSGFAVVTNHSPTAKDVANIKAEIERRKDRKTATDAEIARNMQNKAKQNAELFTILAKEIPILIPYIAAKENRVAVYDALSILEQVPVDEIKAWPAPKLMSRVMSLFKDPGLKDFLDYAESADMEKSPQLLQNSQDQ